MGMEHLVTKKVTPTRTLVQHIDTSIHFPFNHDYPMYTSAGTSIDLEELLAQLTCIASKNETPTRSYVRPRIKSTSLAAEHEFKSHCRHIMGKRRIGVNHDNFAVYCSMANPNFTKTLQSYILLSNLFPRMEVASLQVNDL